MQLYVPVLTLLHEDEIRSVEEPDAAGAASF
jgi:hypothetical protein